MLAEVCLLVPRAFAERRTENADRLEAFPRLPRRVPGLGNCIHLSEGRRELVDQDPLGDHPIVSESESRLEHHSARWARRVGTYRELGKWR